VDIQELKQILSEQFPKVWIKDGKEFDNIHDDSLWTGEGSEIEVKDEASGQTFMMAAFDSFNTSSWYVFGVHKYFHNALEDYGFFTEAYDGGTYFIYEV
jgi:hypothetical protein